MTDDEYIKERLEEQIKWYSNKSKTNQVWYKCIRIVEIVAAAIIPFLTGFSDDIPCAMWIVGGLGVVISVAASITTLYKHHENWYAYRTTLEQLKHERYLYLTRTTPYDTDDRFQKIVIRVESLISKENSQWSDMHEKDKSHGNSSDKKA